MKMTRRNDALQAAKERATDMGVGIARQQGNSSMANVNDPRDPDRMYDPNRPDDLDSSRSVRDRGMGTGTILAVAIAAALIVGGLIFAMSGNRTGTPTATNPPAQTLPTTGQGGTRVNPGPNQNTPNPTPPQSK
jgi:hypothetical protein